HRAAGQHRNHPQPGRQRLGDLPPDPVPRVVDPPPAGLVGQGQPARPDHHHQHTARPQPPQQLLDEIHTRRNPPTVQEHPFTTQPGRQLPIDQHRSGITVGAAVVDEHPAHRLLPAYLTRPPRHATSTTTLDILDAPSQATSTRQHTTPVAGNPLTRPTELAQLE